MASKSPSTGKLTGRGIETPAKIAIITGVVIVVGVIIGAGYRATKPKPKTQETPKTNTQTTQPVVTKANYDGTYTGNTAVASGLANVRLVISGGTATGTATYNGVFFGTKISMPATLTGTVSDKGAVSVNISASGPVMGRSVTVTGKGSGQVTGNNLVGTYTVSGSGVSSSGAVNLTK